MKLTIRPNLEHLAKVLFEKLAPRLAAHAGESRDHGQPHRRAAIMIIHHFDTIEAVGDMHRIDTAVIAGKADIVKRIDALTAAIHSGSETSGLLAQLTTDIGAEIGGLTPQDVGAMLKEAMPIDKLRQTLWTPARQRLMADAVAQFRKDHKFASMVHDGKRKMDQVTGEKEGKLNPTDMIDALQLRLNASLPEQIGSGPAPTGPAIC